MTQITLEHLSNITNIPIGDLMGAYAKQFPHRQAASTRVVYCGEGTGPSNELRRLLTLVGHADKVAAFNPRNLFQAENGNAATPSGSVANNGDPAVNSEYDEFSVNKQAASQWETRPDIRAEFRGDRDAWMAYSRANAKGLTHQMGKNNVKRIMP